MIRLLRYVSPTAYGTKECDVEGCTNRVGTEHDYCPTDHRDRRDA